MATLAFVLAISGAAAALSRLRGSTCCGSEFRDVAPSAAEADGCDDGSDGDSDEVELLQTFIQQEEPRHGGIAVMTASKTVLLSMDGQVTASAQPVLTQVHWPASGPDWIKNRLFASQDRTVAVLIVGVTTMAVLVLLCFRGPLLVAHRRRRKAVGLPEVGETGALKTSMQQQQLKLLKEVTQWNWDDANWQGCWAEAMLRQQTLGAPSALPDLPAPVPRLRTIGASYVVPIGCIKNAMGTTLSFDIPTLPAVWPLRAVLTRTTPQSAWTKIDLTVDVIAAAELPPLLSCSVCSPSGEAHQKCSETTGGTGGTAILGGQSDEGIVPCSQWLAIRNSGGAILASVMPKDKDPTKCVLQRQSHDRVSWDVDIRLDEREPSVVISRFGQEIGQASSLDNYKSQAPCEDSDSSDDEEVQQHLQFDTQPETQTPESLLLLMTFLAMVSFQPAVLPQKQQEGGADKGEFGIPAGLGGAPATCQDSR